jgi:hypothetical protein
MAAQRESSVEEESEWAGISESGDDDMDFEVGLLLLRSVGFDKRWTAGSIGEIGYMDVEDTAMDCRLTIVCE